MVLKDALNKPLVPNTFYIADTPRVAEIWAFKKRLILPQNFNIL
jgi:hypothetical protein